MAKNLALEIGLHSTFLPLMYQVNLAGGFDDSDVQFSDTKSPFDTEESFPAIPVPFKYGLPLSGKSVDKSRQKSIFSILSMNTIFSNWGHPIRTSLVMIIS